MEKIGECAFRLASSRGSISKKTILLAGEAPPLECLNGLVLILINLAFAFLGAIALFFLIFGAIKFITSNGDPKAIKSARDTMTYAVIGTILIISTYVIANIFVKTFFPDLSLFNFHIGPTTP